MFQRKLKWIKTKRTFENQSDKSIRKVFDKNWVGNFVPHV